jgi:HTH-type transcriptional regulator/antitoxin HipB
MSSMKDMSMLNAQQLGRAIRLKRREKGLSQNALAAQLGVDRKWVIHLEAGNPKAELGLILKTLETLELRADLIDTAPQPSAKRPARRPSRLDEVFRNLQRHPRK